jgi:regulatory protein
MTNSSQKNKVFESALRLLNRRDHTEKELEYKLRLRNFDAADIESVLHKCRGFGYINDARTALVIAEQMVSRGNGPLKIRYALEQKGVDPLFIQKALVRCGSEEDQVKNAQGILKKIRFRLHREPEPRKRQNIAYRFLSGRGFTTDVIRRATMNLEKVGLKAED